jgi:hypothetical protein
LNNADCQTVVVDRLKRRIDKPLPSASPAARLKFLLHRFLNGRIRTPEMNC